MRSGFGATNPMSAWPLRTASSTAAAVGSGVMLTGTSARRPSSCAMSEITPEIVPVAGSRRACATFGTDIRSAQRAARRQHWVGGLPWTRERGLDEAGSRAQGGMAQRVADARIDMVRGEDLVARREVERADDGVDPGRRILDEGEALRVRAEEFREPRRGGAYRASGSSWSGGGWASRPPAARCSAISSASRKDLQMRTGIPSAEAPRPTRSSAPRMGGLSIIPKSGLPLRKK